MLSIEVSGWLAEISADLRENGSALEVVLHDYALYKSTFTLLTLLVVVHLRSSFSVDLRNLPHRGKFIPNFIVLA